MLMLNAEIAIKGNDSCVVVVSSVCKVKANELSSPLSALIRIQLPSSAISSNTPAIGFAVENSKFVVVDQQLLRVLPQMATFKQSMFQELVQRMLQSVPISSKCSALNLQSVSRNVTTHSATESSCYLRESFQSGLD